MSIPYKFTLCRAPNHGWIPGCCIYFILCTWNKPWCLRRSFPYKGSESCTCLLFLSGITASRGRCYLNNKTLVLKHEFVILTCDVYLKCRCQSTVPRCFDWIDLEGDQYVHFLKTPSEKKKKKKTPSVFLMKIVEDHTLRNSI